MRKAIRLLFVERLPRVSPPWRLPIHFLLHCNILGRCHLHQGWSVQSVLLRRGSSTDSTGDSESTPNIFCGDQNGRLGRESDWFHTICHKCADPINRKKADKHHDPYDSGKFLKYCTPNKRNYLSGGRVSCPISIARSLGRGTRFLKKGGDNGRWPSIAIIH